MARPGLERLAGWDTSLCLAFNRAGRRGGVCWTLRMASRLGDGLFWYALMAALLVVYRSQAVLPVVHMLITGSLGVASYKWLKTRISRPRPYQIHQDIALGVMPLDQFSFPSGHTLHAVGFTTVALHHYPVLDYPGLAALLVPFALLVALSRPVLGVHYPSDVLAGAALGGTIATLVLLLV